MEKFINISVILPICLHLDQRVFRITYKKQTYIEITTYNFFSNEFSKMGSASNLEVQSDTFSHFRFTNLRMKIPYCDSDKIDLLKIKEKYEKIFFKYYNKFINAYRLITGRKKIRNYWNESEFLLPFDVSVPEDNNLAENHIIHYCFGDEPLVSVLPIRPENDHKLLESYLNEEIPLYEHFMMDAQRDFLFGDYMYSNLNAVIALEIVISDYIRRYASKKGLEVSLIDNFIKDVGLYGNIKVTIKLITSDNVILPSDDVFSNCKTAITTRNKIVHNGLRELDENDLQKNITSIRELIKFCSC